MYSLPCDIQDTSNEQHDNAFHWEIGCSHFWEWKMSQCMRFPTMLYVWPAKPQTSLHICTVWSEPLLVAWIFDDCWETDWTSFGVSKLERKLQRLVRVYTCQNVKLLEISCRDSNVKYVRLCWYGLILVQSLFFQYFCLYKSSQVTECQTTYLCRYYHACWSVERWTVWSQFLRSYLQCKYDPYFSMGFCNSKYIYIWAMAWDFQQYGMCDLQRLRPACAYAQTDQSLC